ncbi:hypothetical protein GS489_01220 [Rhodococcus hoagii]|nr:hypothetical protein [Prescottella equi]
MPRRYRTIEAALAVGVMHAHTPLDAAKIWVWSMRECRHDDPALAEHSPLLLAGLAHCSPALVATVDAVDTAVDRAGAIVASTADAATAITAWDAAEDWQIGKQGYRFDAAALLIGIGRVAAPDAARGALLAAAVDGLLDHMAHQGAIDDTAEDRERARPLAEQAAGRLVDYLAATPS